MATDQTKSELISKLLSELRFNRYLCRSYLIQRLLAEKCLPALGIISELSQAVRCLSAGGHCT